MYRLKQVFEGEQRKSLFLEIGVSGPDEIGRVLPETEKAEAFSQFHAGTGFGLGRSTTFSHLLLVADDFVGFLAANAEINWDIKPAGVDPSHISQNVKLDIIQFLLELGYGLFRRADLILVIGVEFETISISEGGGNSRALCYFAHGPCFPAIKKLAILSDIDIGF